MRWNLTERSSWCSPSARLSINGGSGVIPPLAIISVLMAMIFAGGHISGGHYNPAVTLGIWMSGRTEGKDVIPAPK
jgi:aquaporin Z